MSIYQTGYVSLIDAIVDMQERGFFLDFCLIGNRLLCAQQKVFLQPEEFDILEMYRFHGDGHDQEETIVYGIESPNHSMRGILLRNDIGKKTSIPSVITRKIRKFWV